MEYGYSYEVASQASPMSNFLSFAFSILMLVSMWKLFTKAGKEGWISLIPFYNIFTAFNIGGASGWYLFLMFVPLVNIYGWWKLNDGIAKAFGQTTGFTVLMFFLPFVGYPMLAFGDYNYEGVTTAE